MGQNSSGPVINKLSILFGDAIEDLKTVETIDFTPAVYEHAAAFVGRTPWEVSRDPELMFEGHRRAYLEYRHQVIVAGIDIYNLEAEAYGAVVEPCEGNAPPAIHRPLISSAAEGLALKVFDPYSAGRIAQSIGVGVRLKKEFPDANVSVPVAGPFSIAFNLRGISDLCLDAAMEPETTANMLMHLAENQAGFCKAVTSAGLGIAFFESAAAPPILSPEIFREVELPALKRILEIAAECARRPVPCIMGGNTYPLLDDLLSTGTGFLVCNVETDQAAFVDRVWKTHPHVKVRVNIDSGSIAGSDTERIYRAVDRALSIIGGRTNCVMGSGALPYETPPQNIRLIREYLAGKCA